MNVIKGNLALIGVLLLVNTACSDSEPGTSKMNDPVFVNLFDGESLDGWRINEGTTFIDGSERWSVENRVRR